MAVSGKSRIFVRKTTYSAKKMKAYAVLLSIFFLLCGIPTNVSATIDYRTYKLTTDDGLCSNYVRSMMQDSEGYLWLATVNGISRYDGYTFKNYWLEDRPSRRLMMDNRTSWIAEWQGRFVWVRVRGPKYACYDKQTNTFVDYTGDSTLHDSYSNCTILADGQLWHYDKERGCRLVSFDGVRFSCRTFNKANGRLPSDRVYFIHKSADGATTFIGTATGLAAWKDGRMSISHGSSGNIIAHCISGRADYFVSQHGQVLKMKDGHLKIVLKELPDEVTGMTPLDGQLLITTRGRNWLLQPQTGKTAPAIWEDATNCSIDTDNHGNAVVSNSGGFLLHIDSKTQQAKRLLLPCTFTEGPRFHVVTASNGDIWVATYGQGLFVYEKDSGKVVPMERGRGHNAPTNTRYLLGLMEDSHGNLWVSQEDLGLSCLNIRHTQTRLHYLTHDEQGSHSQVVRMVQQLSDSSVWAAGYSGGLFRIGGDATLHTEEAPLGSSVLAMALLPDGRKAIGTRGNGLFIDGRQYRHNGQPQSLSANTVNSILVDNKGRIWLSASGGGLDMAEARVDGSFHFHHFIKDSRNGVQGHLLKSDHRGCLWYGTEEGLFLFHPDSLVRQSDAYRRLPVFTANPRLDVPHAISEDSTHHVWVACAGMGITRFDNRGRWPRQVKTYTTRDGLPDNMVESVVVDNSGTLWIGTGAGLAYYNKAEDTFVPYRLSNNRMSQVCMENAACRLPGGQLAFGTKYGLLTFNPTVISQPELPPLIHISDVSVNGTLASDEEPMTADVAKQAMQLAYSQNSLTFYLTDLGFDPDQPSRYSYRLEGYEHNWCQPTTDHRAVYKNLPPGRYTLHARSCNVYGQWCKEEATMTVVIDAPWWATWWARMAYLIVLGGIIFGIYRHFSRMNALRNKIRVENEVTELKLRFFTNISHEFRTPLTIIRGAMERIATSEASSAGRKQALCSMQKATDRLLRLVGQLLEFRKMQAGRLQLAVEHGDIVEYVRNIVHSFHEVAQNRHVTLSFLPQQRQHTMLFDHQFLETAAYNLLSNALKYTPGGGSVTVNLRFDDLQCTISITDTGVGVPKEKQGQLFQRFMQTNQTADSIGIGLHLTAEMMRIHHGSIAFEENPGGGSIFTLTLPMDEAVYTAEERMTEDHRQLQPAEEPMAPLDDVRELAGLPLNDDRTVMVVEDDDDVREFIVRELQKYFRTEAFANGKEAWDRLCDATEGKATAQLVVSDVMMPLMNGYELLSRIKAESRLRHIPVVLLTALTAEEKHLKGINAGADAYIEKPFSVALLVAECRRLMMQRDQLKEVYADGPAPARPTEVITDELDRHFRATLDSLVRSRLADADFSVDTLASQMGYSRTTFYKKVQALTGQTPQVYITAVRMEQACELLRDDTLTIAEVCYRVGIADPAYFTRLFKKQKGITPTEYRNGRIKSYSNGEPRTTVAVSVPPT